jgi:glycosyltransferase involved in cell wall biosynthesis
MKTFVQIVLSEDDGAVSGAELRNVANLSDLSRMATGEVFSLSALPKSAQSTLATHSPRDLTAEIARLLKAVRRRKPDFVLLEGVALLEVAKALRQEVPDIFIITDFHNVESALLAENELARLPGFLRRLAPLLARRRVAAALAADREIASLSDLVWTCSGFDEELVQKLAPNARTAVVPNPIPEWTRDAGMTHHHVEKCVLFVGHLGYPPNKRAVRLLCAEIMPLVQAEIKGAYLQVCGRRPNARLRDQLSAAGARLAVNPPDLAPFYASAVATALPLHQGGGTRIKAIEALSIGCPIVATAKAVAGLHLVPGQHYLPAETPAEFARSLILLMQDETARTKLVKEGKSFVLENFGPEIRQNTIQKSLHDLFEKSGRNAPPSD